MQVQHVNPSVPPAAGSARDVQSGFTVLLADYSTCFDFGEFERSRLGLHRTPTSASNRLHNRLRATRGRDADIALEHSAWCGHYARFDGLVTLRFFECHCGPLFNSGRILSRRSVISFSDTTTNR
jgi:hypothetical protein